MPIIKEKCPNCRGTGKVRNIAKHTGNSVCFLCEGSGKLTLTVSEEELAAWELQHMTKEQLALVDHDKYYWQCCIDGCERHTLIRDYGIEPIYYTRWGWLDLSMTVMRCAKHAKEEDKLKLNPPRKQGCGIKHLVAL